MSADHRVSEHGYVDGIATSGVWGWVGDGTRRVTLEVAEQASISLRANHTRLDVAQAVNCDSDCGFSLQWNLDRVGDAPLGIRLLDGHGAVLRHGSWTWVDGQLTESPGPSSRETPRGRTLDFIASIRDSEWLPRTVSAVERHCWGLDDLAFVVAAYGHLLHRRPDPLASREFVALLASGELSRKEVLTRLATSHEFNESCQGLFSPWSSVVHQSMGFL